MEVLVHSYFLLHLLYLSSFYQVGQVFPLWNQFQFGSKNKVLHLKQVFLFIFPVLFKFYRNCGCALIFQIQNSFSLLGSLESVIFIKNVLKSRRTLVFAVLEKVASVP